MGTQETTLLLFWYNLTIKRKRSKENICLQIGFLCLFFRVSIVQFPGGLGLGVAGIHISADTL